MDREKNLGMETRSALEIMNQFTIDVLAEQYGVDPDKVGMLMLGLAREVSQITQDPIYLSCLSEALIGPQDTREHVISKLQGAIDEYPNEEKKVKACGAFIDWLKGKV